MSGNSSLLFPFLNRETKDYVTSPISSEVGVGVCTEFVVCTSLVPLQSVGRGKRRPDFLTSETIWFGRQTLFPGVPQLTSYFILTFVVVIQLRTLSPQ